MTEVSRGVRERPLSPHMQVWRWHLTMLTSILHRATGSALYGGAIILAAWAIALASGPANYLYFMQLLGSPLGRVVMFGLTVSLFYHLANGIRHLVWDAGKGLDIKTSNLSGAAVIAFGVAAAIAVWVIAAMMGALA